ncbi:MAG TPA: alpha/beta fold hydrolase [Nitrospiraceae bacterium]|nr:alpha/beta fold hydrolase [Nitrospiraceae bacterium]
MKTRINGINLAYNDQGTGTALIFLHAFPLNRTMWRPQEEALSRRYRVVVVDLRGHGESDAPLWRFTLEQYADDVAGLMDHLSIPRAVLVGLSMGGYVGFAFYRKYAERVRGLVLADTRAQADTDEARTGRFNLAQTAFRQGPEAVADIMIPKLLGASSLKTKPDLVDHVRRMITGNEVSGMIVDLIAMADRPDSLSLLPQITCPTVVIVGEEDHTTPAADARLIVQGIAGAKLAVIPGAGHISNLEQPEQFNKVIDEFAAGLR